MCLCQRFSTFTVNNRTIEPLQNENEAEVEELASQAVMQMEYLRGLTTRRDRPADDLISALVVSTSQEDAEQVNEQELLASLQLLIAAGYETTVNSITNGMLTLLHHPDVLARLRRDPDMVIRTVEEVVRYDPPVHIRTRTTLADINIAGVNIASDRGVSVSGIYSSISFKIALVSFKIVKAFAPYWIIDFVV